MDNEFFPINSPLINYFFYNAPSIQNGPNIPLADGFIFFFDDTNHNVMLPTYSDVSDPNNPVVNPNPLPLGAAGECPLFYLENKLYYIVITDSTGDIQNPIATINHYNPANFQQGQTSVNNNFFTNGQFSYPINFFQDGQAQGLITNTTTVVAWGWEFLQDPKTTTKNNVTFNDVSSEGIEGNPILEIQLESNSPQIGENTKDFRGRLGSVNLFESTPVTFSFQLQSKTSGNVFVNLILEKNYGPDGSASELILLTTFTVTPVRQKFVLTTTLPSNIGKTITDGNFLAARIQMGIGQSCKVSMTNALFQPGVDDDPVYVQESYGDTIAQILGVSTQIENAGLSENFSPYYYHDGVIDPIARTGEIILLTNNTNPSFAEACDGTSRNVSGYSGSANIPYRRLYNKIGRTFGGTGELIVTANGNVLTFQSGVGGIEKTAYSAQTSGFTVVNTVPGLKFGVMLERTSSVEVTATWVHDFAPNQIPGSLGGYSPPVGLMGYWTFPVDTGVPQNQIQIDTVDPGSVSTQAIATLTFNNFNTSGYQTVHNPTSPFIEFSTFSNNSRGNWPNFNQLIFFSVDGSYLNISGITAVQAIVVPFLTSNSLSQNIDVFVRTVANPFQWTVTVNSVPLASQYFFYSSDTTDYTGYFVVDGVGTDPAVGGRTSVPIATSSTDTTAQVAQKIATTIDDFTFNLPSSGDLPDLQVDSLVDWYIYL